MARNAFNLIVSAVAAVATFVVSGGNFALASVVFSLGNIAANILNPSTPSADLDDLRANKSSYGEPIPIIYNETRLGGHLVWASEVRAKERGHGGYEYGQDLRWHLCERPRLNDVGEFYVTVKQIFLNKQLVFDIDPTAQLSTIIDLIGQSTVVANSIGNTIIKTSPRLQAIFDSMGSRGIQQFTIYYGDADQQPHPVQAAAMGFDNTPAYRGIIGLACDNVPLHLYGNAPPQIEVVLTVWTVGTTPDFIIYDPAWAEGVPDNVDLAALGYRNVLELFHSPTYHPNTVLMMLQDTELLNESAVAVGRRSAVDGEWEQSGAVNKVALLDYVGDAAYTFRWNTTAPYLLWPPISTKMYSLKHEDNAGATSSNCWWVEWGADYPFTFVQKSPTPDDEGSIVAISSAFSFTSNKTGTLVGAMHNSLLAPARRQFSLWHPSSNTVEYFTSNDAGFGGIYSTFTPAYMLIDKNDHLWLVRSSCAAGNAVPLYLDEFSITVSVGIGITLTHLNRYALNDQSGGLNTLSITLSGMTYHETDDTIVFHWHYAVTQNCITRFDLATRSKKLNDADSVRLYNVANPTEFLSYGDAADNHIGRGSALNESGSGVSGLIGTSMNYDGDRTFGLWTEQTWTVYQSNDDDNLAGDIANGFWLIDIATGAGTLYGPVLWADFIDGDYALANPPGNPGVIDFNGSIYIPDTIGESAAFWAGRFGDLNEGDFVGSTFLPLSQGFGRYFLNPGATTVPYNLQQINEDIADRTGSLVIASDTDFSALATIEPWGYAITNRAPARSAIEQLQLAFLYDVYESDHILKAKLREGNSVAVTIDESEVLADSDQRHFSFKDNNEMERPRYIDLRYISRERDHQTGIAPARIGGGTVSDRNAITVELPVVMESSDSANCPGAFTIANRIIRAGWAEREDVGFGLPTRYLPYEVTDLALLTRASLSFETKFVQDGLGVDWSKQLGAISHDSGLYSSTARGTVRDFTPPPQIKLVPAPRMVVIDTGMTNEADDTIGYFVTAIPTISEAQGGLWGGATLSGPSTSSTNFSVFGSIPQGPTGGIMQEALAEPASAFSWDYDSIIKVYMTRGAPQSYSEADLLANPTLGLYWVGGANGEGELIQAATSSKKAAGVYWLSNLLRGRFGTEQHVAGHVTDETLVLFDRTKFLDVTYDRFQIDAPRYWRADNASQQQYSDVVTADQTTRRLWPYAPAGIVVTRDSGDNIIATFVRRSRTRADDPLNDPPIFEVSEDYESDVIGFSGAVMRTITTTASAGGSYINITGDFVFYSDADQITDWGSLLAEGGGDIEIYQLNAIVGRGYPGRAMI